jgi:hypothetical protein
MAAEFDAKNGVSATRWEMTSRVGTNSFSRRKEKNKDGSEVVGCPVIHFQVDVLCCAVLSGRRLPAPKLIRESAGGRVGSSGSGVGWRNWDQDGKKPASSAFSIGPVFHPASRSRARHGENQSTNSLPPPTVPPANFEPTDHRIFCPSLRHRTPSPSRSPNHSNFSTAAEAFGPTHPPPPSS